MLTIVGAKCGGHATTLFYAANNANWSPSTSPNSNYYSGVATNFFLTEISAPSGTMTANFSMITPAQRTIVNILSQNFDAVTFPQLPPNWNSTSATIGWATSTASVNPVGISPHSGANLSFLNCYEMLPGESATLVSPAFSLSGFENGRVKFWLYRDSGGYTFPSSNDDRVGIYVNTTGGLSGATLLGTVNRRTTLAPVVSTPGWYEYSFDLPGSSTTNYIIFNGISGYGNDIHLDDITVYAFSTTTPPTAPTITSAKAGNAQASIYFSPPDSTGGSPITGYTVTSSLGITPPSSFNPIIVSGLVNSSPYTFTVTAINSAGPGTSSAVSDIVTPGLVVNSGYDATGYQTIQSAYAGPHGTDIQIQAGVNVGTFTKTGSDTLFISGGYDSAFLFGSGASSILGKTTLQGGTTRVQNIRIR